MTDVAKLRALLVEAQRRLECERFVRTPDARIPFKQYKDTFEDCDCADCDLKARIDAALAEPDVRRHSSQRRR